VYQLIEGGRRMLWSDYYCVCVTVELVSSVCNVATHPLQKLEAQKRFSLVSTKDDLWVFLFSSLWIEMGIPILYWPQPPVRDLTRDVRLSTYDKSVLKLSKVSFRGKCARTWHSKATITNKTRPAGPSSSSYSASQAGRLAGPVFYAISFSLVIPVGRAGGTTRRENDRARIWPCCQP
jgi:hypothetical protein